MKNKIFIKNIIYPWDIDGYVKLSEECKNELIIFLLNRYGRIKNINKALNLPEGWFNNFKRTDKVHTAALKKIVSITNKNLCKNIIKFNDDKGSSSIPFTGKFPIKYDPLWHFIFCFSVGDGHISGNYKKRFTWYQKPEGQKKLIELLNKINFKYSKSANTAKRGIIIPQLIRKVGSFITGLDSRQKIKGGIVEVSNKLGKDYELALLCAFFIDEAGMGKTKSNSEVTLHQEGNLPLLEKIGDLLKKFNVKWSRNKKGDKWCIRINSEGVIQLSKLFSSLKKYNINLLHRGDIFQRKVKKSEETLYRLPLRNESISIRKYILNNCRNKIVSLDEIRNYFKPNLNVSTRSRQLVHFMKKRNELQTIALGKYIIKSK